MIGKLRGAYGGATREGAVIVEVGGVGYVVRVPATLIPALAPQQSLELFVHTAVRDDAIDLYGFPAEEELAFFKLLTSVSGVGPKTALGLMSAADARALSRAIAASDTAILIKMYGVGKKMAERIVVELRDKLRDTDKGGALGVDAEVMQALEALGYRAGEARDALRALPHESTDIKERLAAALKQLGAATK